MSKMSLTFYNRLSRSLDSAKSMLPKLSTIN